MTRRELKFTTLDEAMAEARRLGTKDHATTGNWSFYQILKHLTDIIENSYQKPPGVDYPEIPARTTEVLFKRIQRSGKMSAGHLNPKLPQAREEGDYKQELARMERVVASFKEHGENLMPDEHLGRLTASQWDFLHAIHFALHLSFVVPD